MLSRLFRLHIEQRIPERMAAAALAALALALLITPTVLADVEVPLSTTTAFIQTTGRLAGAGIGDYRTSSTGDSQPHSIFVNLSCQPGRQYRFDLYDPALDAGTTIDEIRNAADQTLFRMLRPDSSQLYPASGWLVYTSGTSNDAWTTLTSYTVPASPVPGVDCGTFIVQSWTGIIDPADPNYATVGVNNDDNAWRFRLVGIDNGSGSPFAAENGPDNQPGTGDESWIGLQFTSYQHNPAGCQDFYWYVAPGASNLYMINFDMDGSQRVCYFPPGVGGTCTAAYPGAPVIQGTLSVNLNWNSTPAQTTRPTFANMALFDGAADFAGDAVVSPGNGIWRSQLCVGTGNQYSMEVPGYTVFLGPPDLPAVQVAKTDGVTMVNSPGTTTYTLTLTNTGTGAAMPVAGYEVVDTLPAGMTATSCTVNAPLVGTCTGVGTGTLSIDLEAQSALVLGYLPSVDNAPNNVGTITIGASIAEGLVGPLTNNVTVEWTDIYDNVHPPATASDEDLIRIDLELSKGMSPASPNVGDTVTYTLTLTNNSQTTATNIVITDNVPAQISVTNVTASTGSWSAPDWSIASLVGGGSATLTITGTVVDTGTISNQAEVASVDQEDADSTPGNCALAQEDDCGIQSFTLAPAADLRLAKSVSPTTGAVGDTVTYTLTITNDGPDDTTGVEVTDNLPAGISYDTCTPPGATTFDTGTGVWTIGALANGVSLSLVCDATINDATEQINVAEVTASDVADPDSTPGNGVVGEDDRATANVNGGQVDLSLAKTVDNAAPSVGDTVTFTLTVTNNSAGATGTDIGVSDLLPGGFIYQSDAPSQGAYVPGTGVWSVGSLGPGASATLDITAVVDIPTGAPGEYSNYAEIETAGQPDPDSTPGNDSTDEDDDATTPVTPRLADLELGKAASSATPALGDAVTFTLTLSNNGPDATDGVQVRDILPAALTYVGYTASQGTYDSATGIWDVGALAVEQTVTLEIEATVAASGVITNVAEVIASTEWDPDSTPGNGVTGEDDLGRVTLTVAGPGPAPSTSDPALSKAGEPAEAVIGEEVRWTIHVSNPTGSPMDAVVVSDPVPAMFDILDVTSSQGAVSVSGQVITANIGTLAAGQSATITVATVANALAEPGTACNTAAAGTASARGCVLLLPAVLPLTGGGEPPQRGPEAWVFALAAVLVIGAGAAAFTWKRRAA